MGAGLMRPLGRALRGVRAGTHGLATSGAWLAGVPEHLRVTSQAFGAGVDIPAQYTAVSPPLAWSGVPAGTASLALLVEDADVPLPFPLVHALVYAIPASLAGLAAGDIPGSARATAGFRVGRNGLGRAAWLPIAPPPGHGPHHYAFQVFALDRPLRFDWPPGRHALIRAMRGHVLAWGALFGVFENV